MERKKISVVLWMMLILSALTGGCCFVSNNTGDSGQNEITLWNYEVNNSNEFNFPVNYQEYVMPDNIVVQQHAQQLKVGSYWNYLTYENGSILNLSYQNDTKEGYWQNPDYTLTVGHGDCEDIALAVCSILEAKGIKAIVVMGYFYNSTGKGNEHAWVEYYSDGNYYISDRFSFKRKLVVENKIAYYFSPEITAVSSSHPDQIIFSIAPTKYQPRYIFNDNLKRRPYHKNWIILV